MRVDELIAAHASRDGERTALILPARGRRETQVSFQELESRIQRVAAGLSASGLQPGERAAMLVPPTAEFFILAFGLLRLGAVPVLIDPGIGRQHLRTCLNESQPAAFIGVVKAHLARRVLGWVPDVRMLITVGKGPAFGTRLREVEGRAVPGWTPPPRAAHSTAAIAFTSGSTGVPKGVEQTQEMLLAQTELIAELYDLGPHQTSLATFPPFALFGPPHGMTTVLPKMDPSAPAKARPKTILAAANKHRATVLFGSPALLDTLARGASDGRMPTVQTVISAGAPVPRSTQQQILGLLEPGAQVFSPYGATEALPVASIGSAELLTLPAGICVGRPVPGVRVCLIRIDDGPVPELHTELLVKAGETGEVVVCGPNVTLRYAERPDQDKLAKTVWDGQIAHRMGDLASMDSAGRLWFAGRKSHRVETSKGALYSVPCEEIYNSHPLIRRTALVGVGAMGAQTPVLCVELEGRLRSTAALTAEIRAMGAAQPLTADITKILYHPGFPVDIRHNSKIDRAALAGWATKQASE